MAERTVTLIGLIQDGVDERLPGGGRDRPSEVIEAMEQVVSMGRFAPQGTRSIPCATGWTTIANGSRNERLHTN